jgi:DNA segregation ATPase FtsK/SpoIIIE-like protein
MDASALTPCLSELRRELEDILAMVARDVREDADTAVLKSLPAPEPIESVSSESSEVNLPTEPDNLFDDALVVVTEFGKATPAALQMWLSIDYARAARILSDFEARGLVSSKGRVRHKAYELRRARSLESGRTEFRL